MNAALATFLDVNPEWTPTLLASLGAIISGLVLLAVKSLVAGRKIGHDAMERKIAKTRKHSENTRASLDWLYGKLGMERPEYSSDEDE